MSFPILSVLDPLTVNESPISHSGDWTNGSGGAASLIVTGNVCTTSGGFADAVWQEATSFGPNLEMFWDMRSNGGNGSQAYQLSRYNPASGGSWIIATVVPQFNGNGSGVFNFVVDKRITGTSTTLGTLSGTVTTTSSRIGYSLVGDTLTYYIDGTSIGSVTGCSAVPSAGRFYIGLDSSNWQIVNFGGGTLTSGAPTLTQLERGIRGFERGMFQN